MTRKVLHPVRNNIREATDSEPEHLIAKFEPLRHLPRQDPELGPWRTVELTACSVLSYVFPCNRTLEPD